LGSPGTPGQGGVGALNLGRLGDPGLLCNRAGRLELSGGLGAHRGPRNGGWRTTCLRDPLGTPGCAPRRATTQKEESKVCRSAPSVCLLGPLGLRARREMSLFPFQVPKCVLSSGRVGFPRSATPRGPSPRTSVPLSSPPPSAPHPTPPLRLHCHLSPSHTPAGSHWRHACLPAPAEPRPGPRPKFGKVAGLRAVAAVMGNAKCWGSSRGPGAAQPSPGPTGKVSAAPR
jgi:hypothetical protein